MPYHAMPIYLAIQWRASWAHIMPYQTRLELLSLGLYHPIPFHTMLYHLILCHTMENHLGTCHAMPCLSQRPPPSPSVCSALHLVYVVDCTRVLRLLQSFGLPESLPYPVTGEAIVILGKAPLPVTKSSYLQTMSKTAHHLHL